VTIASLMHVERAHVKRIADSRCSFKCVRVRPRNRGLGQGS